MIDNCAGTDGIIKKIREVVGDKPVYLSIDVSESDQVNGVNSLRNTRRSIRSTQLLHQPQARLRLEVGRPASCAPS
jgi:hypothetical protein